MIILWWGHKIYFLSRFKYTRDHWDIAYNSRYHVLVSNRLSLAWLHRLVHRTLDMLCRLICLMPQCHRLALSNVKDHRILVFIWLNALLSLNAWSSNFEKVFLYILISRTFGQNHFIRMLFNHVYANTWLILLADFVVILLFLLVWFLYPLLDYVLVSWFSDYVEIDVENDQVANEKADYQVKDSLDNS